MPKTEITVTIKAPKYNKDLTANGIANVLSASSYGPVIVEELKSLSERMADIEKRAETEGGRVSKTLPERMADAAAKTQVGRMSSQQPNIPNEAKGAKEKEEPANAAPTGTTGPAGRGGSQT